MKNKYEQVTELIEERIQNGIYQVNDFIPGERVLANDFGVGRVTVRTGLKYLVKKGLLDAVNGKGYCVVSPKKKSSRTKTGLIGGVFAGEKNPISTGVAANGVSSTLEKNDYHLIYSSSELQPNLELQKIRNLYEKGIDGLLVMPVYRRLIDSNEYEENGNYQKIKEFYDSGLPVVLVDRSYANKGIPCVCNDDVAGGYMATKYLYDRGHRKIAFFAGDYDRIGRQRYAGYINAVKEFGIENHTHMYSRSLFDKAGTKYFPECVAVTRELLENLNGVTAILTSGFFARYIADIVCAEKDKYSGVEWTGYDIPPENEEKVYAWFQRPMEKIGELAAEKLVRLINEDKDAATEIYLEPELVNE